ncbi:MAG: peptidoglycan DD-metalloendopeptidase family protein [Deltaproteobacteria bacterium]|nr:peptidoglycan DD-metalloendopeptidase family protein [Deltaproteobacteria bacterium]MBW1962908.1 peptidoglycan DD-metalloendopeptidase family protein [Deltaproteobacteria bacterium]MBW1994622.1 peptidoglycan DD-metalloendopeptidase family protein [Deltaproteobacteria bacterium]MBW2150452.1 peptidoglycan DD-metalloendopeptidase family protein [Deltaproteobacteria bacterium]
MKSRIQNNLEEITAQRKQIQKFAKEINSLKSKLLVLRNSEEKIRIIANIEQQDSRETLFGVGGSLPEDLNAQIDLSQKHNSLIREMHRQVEQLHVAIKHQYNRFDSLLKHLERKQNILACTPSIRPVDGWITSRFGNRISPFTGLREFHKGLDIAARRGTPVAATADGIVTYVGYKGQLGKVIVIDHGYGMVTRYGHIQKALKKRGDRVKRGEKIALVGDSGRTTGPHVHYEVLLNGLPVNPEKYIFD